MAVMTDLAQAQARILELESKNEALTNDNGRVRNYSASLHDFIQWLSQRHPHDGLTKIQIIHMAAKLDVGGKWQDDHVKFDGRTAIEVLEAENAALRQDRGRLARIVEKADALLKEARTVASERIWNACEAYQEARRG